MKTISAKVNDVEVILENENENNILENQINVAKIQFEFDESWNKYDKYVVFMDEHDQMYKTAILNNEVFIPSALVDGFIKFQVYGQIINDSTILERQPSKVSGFKLISSLNPTGLDVEILSPNEWDNYIKQIEDITNKIVSDEATRVENETNRETAEASRVSSEKARESAEEERIKVENDRIKAEGKRVGNETNRETAENSRVSSEKARENAETERIKAENDRIKAEGKRIENETNREQYITDLKRDVDAGRFNGECNFATFNINLETGNLEMNKTETLLVDFDINKDGYLEVIV